MTDPQSKNDLLGMKMPEIKKFVKKNKILTGYTNMRKAVLIGEIIISKWWREREKQKQSAELAKQEVKQPVEPVAEMGGEAVEEKKPKKIVDTYYTKELIDDFYSIMGRSLVPYEKTDMKVPIDKYYKNIEKEMDKEIKSGKKIVLQEDPNGIVKLTGKAQKSSEKKPVEQKPTVEEIKTIEKKIQLVPKRATVETIEQKPTEFDIQQVRRDVKMMPKQIESSEIILPTADVVIPMASPSIGGVKDVLSNEQYIRVIRNIRSEFNEFKNRLDGMLSLF
jgi:hypothetical protein